MTETTAASVLRPRLAHSAGDIAGDLVEPIAYPQTLEFVTGEIPHVDGSQSADH